MVKSILITGATGFVGKNLISLLTQQDYQLRAAVRRNKTFPDDKVSTTIVGDIDENTDWQKALLNIDAVVHLAGRAHILKGKSNDPLTEFIKVNTVGTANLVKQSVQSGVKHFIFISSLHAITIRSDRPLNEQSPCQPDTPYGISKLKAEQALLEIVQASAMDWTILRPPLVYGADNPGNMARLIKLIKTGLPLPLSSIHNRRSFIYVGNLVSAIATCLQHPNARGETFLVSDREAISTLELIQLLGKSLDQRIYSFPCPAQLLKLVGQLTNQTSTVDRLIGSLEVDSSKIQTLLDWSPPFTVIEGLSITAQWYKSDNNSCK
jgi:nucleoside-diphosphate-sugar epimerase